MSPSPISHSADLQRLRDDGYNIQIRGAYLVVSDVPYVTGQREVKQGVLAAPLQLSGLTAQPPEDHTVRFAGEYPCNKDGTPLERIRHSETNEQVDDVLVLNWSFSSKPRDADGARNYTDFYEKMTTYIRILESQAQALDPTVSAQTHPPVAMEEDESVFVYLDTASSRAGINAVTKKLQQPKVAIIGLGGTGSYVLDLVAKTPVGELHLFDGDDFYTHNAFRFPGAASLDELTAKPKKVDYLKAHYSRIRRGIVAHPYHVTPANVGELDSMDFVFLCMDGGDAKRAIASHLEARGVPFVDVGIDVYDVDDTLHGTLRVTTSTPDNRAAFYERVSLVERGEDAIYDQNIQVADLNALNATMAVIKWKKLSGFYGDYERELNSFYTIDTNALDSRYGNEA
jgi:hypothetical protein